MRGARRRPRRLDRRSRLTRLNRREPPPDVARQVLEEAGERIVEAVSAALLLRAPPSSGHVLHADREAAAQAPVSAEKVAGVGRKGAGGARSASTGRECAGR